MATNGKVHTVTVDEICAFFLRGRDGGVDDKERLREGEWCQKLREWSEIERKKGLIDIKFFPVYPLRPGEKEPTLEELAKDYYLMLTSTDYEDITDQDL